MGTILIGVVVGFILIQIVELYKYKLKRGQYIKLNRYLLSLEKHKNYRLIVKFWSGVKNIEGHDLSEAIKKMPFPFLSWSQWNSIRNKIVISHTPKEIHRAWDFYEDLSQLTSIYEKLHATEDSKKFVEDFKLIINGIIQYSNISEPLS